MSDNSPRLGLPFMQQGQAQKHVTHNEALEILDLLLQLTVEAFEAALPPAEADEGQIWALGTQPEGAWSGHAGTLAAWANGGWLFIAPRTGWRAAQGDDVRVWTGAQWLRPRLPDLSELPGLGVNAAHDSENRLSVSAPATLLSHEGGDHRLKINKAGAGDTATVLFQSDWSGRAEIGLAGEDDFSFKVSADGTGWTTGLRIAAADGSVTLPAGLAVAGSLSLPAGSVSRAALAQGAARSVIGRSGGSAGAVADISAGSDHQVLRRSGTVIGFGAVNLAQSAAVTGTLGVANGGTGAATAQAARASLGLGTAAVADLMQGQHDGTPGRVARIFDGAGVFGLGVNDATLATVPGNDLNALRLSGIFRFLGDTIAAPATAGVVLHIVRLSGEGGGRHFQMAFTLGDGNYLRAMLPDGSWESWRRLYTSGEIIGPVHQSDGMPTAQSAIIERGSNSNGAYVRFADGMQICTARLNLGALNTGAGTFEDPYRHSAPVSWSFPAVFSAAPRVSLSPFVDGGGGDIRARALVAGFANVTSSQLSAIRACRTTGDNDPADVLVDVTSIGRWY